MQKPRVVIIGGGFGGIHLAKKLAKADCQVILIDKNNYHTFQPLLYQVATAGLGSDAIAAPLRQVFEKQTNFYFRMAEVHAVHSKENSIETTIGPIAYDYLVIATGSVTNYYGNTEIPKKAFPMKQLAEAIDLRSRLLQNLENAVLIQKPEILNSLLDVVIVGGGPTGVELAGALGEMKKYVLPKDYPELDFKYMNIVLIESFDRLLNGMSEEAGKKAYDYLNKFGVKIILGRSVKSYNGYKILLDDDTEILSQSLIWAAGVKGNIIQGLEQSAIDKDRYIVDEYNKVKGYSNIYAIGDVAAQVNKDLPKGLPMLAPVAIQQGEQLAKNLQAYLSVGQAKAFSYKDKGTMATIGRNRAVVDLPGFKTQGIFAWFIWMFVHLFSLIGFRNRLIVLVNWIWSYFTYDKAARLIIRPVKTKGDHSEKT